MSKEQLLVELEKAATAIAGDKGAKTSTAYYAATFVWALWWKIKESVHSCG